MLSWGWKLWVSYFSTNTDCLLCGIYGDKGHWDAWVSEITPTEKVEHALHAFDVGISHENHYTEALSFFLLRSLGKKRISLDV